MRIHRWKFGLLIGSCFMTLSACERGKEAIIVSGVPRGGDNTRAATPSGFTGQVENLNPETQPTEKPGESTAPSGKVESEKKSSEGYPPGTGEVPSGKIEELTPPGGQVEQEKKLPEGYPPGTGATPDDPCRHKECPSLKVEPETDDDRKFSL